MKNTVDRNELKKVAGLKGDVRKVGKVLFNVAKFKKAILETRTPK